LEGFGRREGDEVYIPLDLVAERISVDCETGISSGLFFEGNLRLMTLDAEFVVRYKRWDLDIPLVSRDDESEACCPRVRIEVGPSPEPDCSVEIEFGFACFRLLRCSFQAFTFGKALPRRAADIVVDIGDGTSRLADAEM
jgi:hypothetical protein